MAQNIRRGPVTPSRPPRDLPLKNTQSSSGDAIYNLRDIDKIISALIKEYGNFGTPDDNDDQSSGLKSKALTDALQKILGNEDDRNDMMQRGVDEPDFQNLNPPEELLKMDRKELPIVPAGTGGPSSGSREKILSMLMGSALPTPRRYRYQYLP